MKNTYKLSFFLIWAVAISVHAEVVTDGSLGSVQSLSGNMVIPQNLGKTIGNNLFHSFDTFNINTGERATFTGSDTLQNVISRVTGGQVSTIDGLLKSEIPHANVYFINPAGVTFGANASIDVPAAFHVSTAQKLNFGGEFFDTSIGASAPPPSTLTIAEPTSFGFLGSSSANIGKLEVNGAQLSVYEGKTIDAVVNSIDMKNGAKLDAPAGEIRLVAIKNADDVSLTRDTLGNLPLLIETPSLNNAGDIFITEASLVDASGNGAGRVSIWGETVKLDGVKQDSSVRPQIKVDNTGSGLWWLSDNDATEKQGIEIKVENLNVLNGGKVSSDVRSAGKGADITINAPNIKIAGENYNKTNSGTDASDFTGISADVFKSATGGKLNITSETIDISKMGRISANGVSGQGNNIDVTAKKSLKIEGTLVFDSNAGITWQPVNPTGIFAESVYGTGGNIKVTAGYLEMLTSASISSSAFASKDAGTVTVIADSVKMSGSQATIESGTHWDGDAGKVFVKSKTNIDVSNDAKIATITAGQGKGGDVEVNAETITLNNGGGIFSRCGNNIGDEQHWFVTGDAGIVNVTTDILNMDKGRISSGTYARGNSGTVTVTANDSINAKNFASINSSTYSKGTAGNVLITTPSFSLENNAEIAALASKESTGQTGTITFTDVKTVNLTSGGKISVQNDGTAPDITKVTPANLTLKLDKLTMDGGTITASTGGNINAGNVAVTTSNLLGLSNKAAISSSTAGSGNAGSVTVTAPVISMDDASITAKTTATGSAGNVTVDTPNLSLTKNAEISALADSNSSGQTGSVTINDKVRGSINLYSGSKISVENKGIAANPKTIVSKNVSVNATDLTMDKGTITAATTGNVNAGSVTVTADKITAKNTASINSSTSSSGNAGDINVTAPVISMDDAAITAKTTATGSAGNVTVDTPNLSLTHNAEISALADSNSSGKTGQVFLQHAEIVNLNNGGKISIQNDGTSADPAQITVHDLLIDVPHLSLNGGIITAATGGNVNAGNVAVTTNNFLSLSNSASIESSTTGSGKAGDVTVTAPNLFLDNKASISALAEVNSSGKTGKVNINVADTLQLEKQSKISIENKASPTDSNFSATGSLTVSAPKITLNASDITAANLGNIKQPGNVKINATSIKIDGQTTDEIVSSEKPYHGILSYTTSGNAGAIDITAKEINLVNTGKIMSSAASSGGAGSIKIKTDDLSLEKASYVQSSNVDGLGGTIHLDVKKKLSLIDGGIISAVTRGSGKAGDVTITANTIEAKGVDDRAEVKLGGGRILKGLYSGIYLTTLGTGSGDGGDLKLTTGSLTLSDGAEISASSIGQVLGSKVFSAGKIDITADFINLNSGGLITASTLNEGNAGSIMINANKLLSISGLLDHSLHPKVDNPREEYERSGIISNAISNPDVKAAYIGNSGDITINTPGLEITDNGLISTSTNGINQAGNINLTVDNLTVSNKAAISSASNKTLSGGKTGSINITATGKINLTNNADIDIKNEATVNKPETVKHGAITISAPEIFLKDSSITTNSTGNVDAGHITLNVEKKLSLDPSYITTSAAFGNGGDIIINAPKALISLQNSQISTSVMNAKGNGGNIDITATHLIMDTAAIQANAVSGSGGDINLNLKSLIPSQNLLIKGGTKLLWQPFISGFNVIQAASESGVSGSINLTSPQFDISGSLSNLDTVFVLPVIDNNPCLSATARSSTLARRSKGGIPKDETKVVFVPKIAGQDSLKNTKETLTSSPFKNGLSCSGLSL